MAEHEDTETSVGAVTAEGIDGLRERIGIDWPYTRWSTWNEEASRDAIRHFAFGYGDDNPLWWDPEYSANTRWGGIVAPPTFLETAGISPNVPRPSEPKKSGKGLGGELSMFWGGDHIRFFNVVHEGDRIEVRRFYLEVQEKKSREFGRTALAVRRRVYSNQRGELIAIWDADFLIAPHRPKTEKATQHAGRHVYSDDELAEIDAAYASETVRGAEPRYVEDVKVGEELQPRVKGPLTTSDMIAWLQGSGRHELYPYRLGFKNRKRFPKVFYSKNSFGVLEHQMRGHFDDDYARGIGLAAPYDYGAQRNAWMIQAVTDWAGDDAVVITVDDRLDHFTTIGDLTRVEGAVSGVEGATDWPTVACHIECHNQDGRQTASADIRVRLPSRKLGNPPFPGAPPDGGLLPGMPEPLVT